MKIRLSELRQIIRNVVKECYGWPVEKEEHLYGAPTKIDVQNPRDPKNSLVSMPKGPNSRSGMNESFQKISQAELKAWKQGDYREINEVDGSFDPCEGCGEMVPSNQLQQVEGKYMCQACSGGMDQSSY
jgi:RNA polymerase-binding transcription factor DksA